MRFVEISFSKLKSEIESFLKSEHNRADVTFSPSSPFGQILGVVENLFQLSMLYLKNAIRQFDVTDPASTSTRSIKNVAIAAGHIPTRAISATGTLRLSVKTNADIERDVPGARLTFDNKLLLKNKTNGLFYSLNLGADQQTYKVDYSTQIYLSIIQGKWERKSFTGTGQENQTYQVVIKSRTQDIENFNYEVIVNGEPFTIKKHIYDMLPDEKACVVKSGFNSGVDIIFGNSGFGMIPPIGATIDVNYLVTDGSSGSIFRRTANDWTFIDPVVDGFGETIELAKTFDVSIFTDINFGADSEPVEFTKNVLPISSNNFVLGLPQQYAYHIKRLGVFSHVNAYEMYGMIYIVATPNILLFKNQNANYFNIDVRAFQLDDYEISKIDQYLKTGGNIMLTRRYVIGSPVLSRYVINVFIITWSDAVEVNVNTQIVDVISEYFLNLNKVSRIPRSEIISKLAEIRDIHSVDISFMSKKNEDYHREFILQNENRINIFTDPTIAGAPPPIVGYNQNTSLGIDTLLGDIVFEPEEIPIIRGGFYDRNGVFYSDDIESKGLKSVNVIKKGVVDAKNRLNN
jgi:hypothetical protein